MTKDMTQGSPMKLILNFSIPLLLGYLFQQLYSMVDTIIVGRYLGINELAAVGATGSINFLIIGFCIGVCSGFAIPIAHKFGAEDYSGLRRFVANSTWLSIAFSVVMTVLTVVFCRDILVLMKTPENLIDSAYSYIVIIFIGIPVTYLYNLLAGIIRSLGDSRTPVIFLTLAAVMNVILDIVFIVYFKTGVAGAAWATVISQGVSGICCLLYMIKKFEILHLTKEEWKPDTHLMGILCGMGVPMGLQYSITAIGSVVLQSAINTLGGGAVAAVTAASKIAMFIVCPFDAMGATMATYGGQNVGANKLERLGKGLKSCVILGAVYSAVSIGLILLLDKQMAMLFLKAEEATPAVLADIHTFLMFNACFYFPLALVNIIRFLIQGMGFPKFAILAGVFEMIARAVTAFGLVPVLGYIGVCLGNPMAWILADIFLIPAYFYCMKKLRRQMSR